MIRKRPNDRSTNRQQRSSLWQKCTNLRALKQVHASMVVNGFNSNYSAIRELIFCGAMAISGTIDYAHQVFDHVSEPDNFLWNTMIRGSAQSQCPLNAVLLYTRMENRHARPDDFTFPFVLKACTKLSWVKMGMGIHGKVVRFGFESNTFVRNTLIYFHANCGDLRIASALFDDSAKRDVVPWSALTAGYPDEVTMLSLLSACADIGDLDVGQKIHSALLEMGSGDMSIILGNAVIDMYSKCGSIERALEVFRRMRDKDVSSWNSVIGGLAFHGHSEESVNLFKEMRRLKVRPNEITFVGVLVACSHAGKVEEGRGYFNLMRIVYRIEPNIKHYGCMVDLLGRAGILNEAFEFIEKMEIAPNAIVWRTLLGACRVHGNVELGRRANERLLEMRRDESGDFVLLSNIYASRGEWQGVEEVRKLMDDSGVKKEAGCSLVEADNSSLMHFLFDSKPKSR
ncbi:pentatricopeptide repeat-containing protein [Pyrus ussuriensis x Pyrus communis]|uniref:Pentatricopeptide repeat-containing protein n=1 Tax=Pyrus ussuriensis x Pyrus communis TaxID=2448454 RepID=A0A5N5GF74_9ROSA|nr:pentatricopeptide repeat-containing protein [Pyrus ussuriensis x Pyrus communis]